MTQNEFQTPIFELQQMIKKLLDGQNQFMALSNEKERLHDLFNNLSYLLDQLITICHIDGNQIQEKNSVTFNESKYHLMSETIMVNPKHVNTEEINLKTILHDIEVAYIKEALSKEKGVVSHAAKRLGIRRTTLVEKMKKFEMTKHKDISLIR